ncbi:phage tail termination protein [Serratia quinivorans]|uniref:phage tail termination protein n=1 Tax=Serratia quinivorans TaxID=137545 RepID=UPI003981FE68
MTPAMHRRVRDYFVDAGLTTGFITQMLRWRDTGKDVDKFIVFRPNSGSAIRNDLASEYLVMVDVVGAINEDEGADNAAQAIISHIQANPMPNDCIGHIENVGGIPSPVSTTEGRLVYRLQFACLYGE